MGLAACGYIRRVIEHRINDLIDLIIEVDKATGESPNTDNLQAIKKARMSDRLDFAGKILPARLKPGGRNPLDGMYTVVSDAIHQRSEQECLSAFDVSRIGFEYLFKHLKEELEQKVAYVKALEVLDQAKQARSKS